MHTLDFITIKNFQSHKISELHFAEGVNVIIGPSDAGKSAIFRALNWVLTNRPLGDAFCSEWGGETRVVLQTEEEDILTRVKDRNINQYELGDMVLKAFGSEPPEVIQQTLQMDEINIQSQTDPPFLLVNTPGEVAQKLNRAADIEDIDVVMTGLKKGHNEFRRNIQNGEEWLKEQIRELEEYKDLDFLEEVVHELENLRRMEFSLQSQISRLTNICRRADELEIKIKKAKYIDKAAGYLEQAEREKEKQNEIQKQLNQLKMLVDRVELLDKQTAHTNQSIEQLSKEYDEIAPEICPLCGNPMKEKK